MMMHVVLFFWTAGGLPLGWSAPFVNVKKETVDQMFPQANFVVSFW